MTISPFNRLKELTQQLQHVVRGYHPITLKPYAEGSDLKDPAVVELHVTLLAELLTMPATVSNQDYKTFLAHRENERRGNPRNHNVKWTTDEIIDVGRQFMKGTNINELAEIFGRTTGSIIARLKATGTITDEEADELYQSTRK